VKRRQKADKVREFGVSWYVVGVHCPFLWCGWSADFRGGPMTAPDRIMCDVSEKSKLSHELRRRSDGMAVLQLWPSSLTSRNKVFIPQPCNGISYRFKLPYYFWRRSRAFSFCSAKSPPGPIKSPRYVMTFRVSFPAPLGRSRSRPAIFDERFAYELEVQQV